MDLLCSGVAANETAFGLTGDEVADTADVDALLEVAASLRGDADLDGNVNVNDFLALSRNFGNDGTWSQGDFDCDGTVTTRDFLQLSRNFGQSGAPAAASVPEPDSTTLLIGCAALVLPFVGRRRRRQGWT